MLQSKFYMPIDCSVQAYWNLFEHVLVILTDIVAPLIKVEAESKPNFIPPFIKNKINKCKCLIKNDRLRNSTANFENIKLLSKEIKSHFDSKKRKKVNCVALGNENRVTFGKPSGLPTM